MREARGTLESLPFGPCSLGAQAAQVPSLSRAWLIRFPVLGELPCHIPINSSFAPTSQGGSAVACTQGTLSDTWLVGGTRLPGHQTGNPEAGSQLASAKARALDEKLIVRSWVGAGGGGK